jgi:hypothetical protein
MFEAGLGTTIYHRCVALFYWVIHYSANYKTT